MTKSDGDVPSRDAASAPVFEADFPRFFRRILYGVLALFLSVALTLTYAIIRHYVTPADFFADKTTEVSAIALAIFTYPVSWWAASRAFAPMPVLRISQDGIVDRMLSKRTIPWEAIDRLTWRWRWFRPRRSRTLRRSHRLVMRLDPHHPVARSILSANPLGHLLGLINREPHLRLTLDGLDYSVEEVVEEIERYMPVEIKGRSGRRD